jgi:alanyl-tRNA synthetase
VVAQAERGAGPARALALALSEHGRLAVVSSVDEGRAYLCLARPKGPGPDLGALLREAVALLGGKGGGSPDLAQGSGEPPRLAEALALVRSKLGG